ncbi:unnamed protein product, partial [Polarella glacialis]
DDGPKNVCFMKKLEANAEPHMVIKDGLISGYPCCRPTSSPTEYIQSECPGHFADTDLSTKSGLPSKYGITSADWCQRVCTEDADCGAWTWGEARNVPGLSDVCYMKKLAGDEAPGMHMKQGVVSGLPCGCRSTAMNAIWPDTDVQRFDMPAPRALQKPEPASMLCVALMLPYSYEQDMLVMQFQEKANIFGCDHWAVYSNQEMKLAPGLVTRRVQTTQRCEIGGEFGTALNLGVFTALWRQVLLDDEYVKVNWIIKADPDTVFFPERLRPILKAMEKKEGNGRDGKGVYLNNCKYGLHGPIEVFSTRAISTLANDFETCFAYFRKLCSGDCLWGEDMWVDQCLQRVANVTRIDEFKLLSESHCDPEPGWNSCYDHSKVAFHPFKDISGYKTCLQSAREEESQTCRPEKLEKPESWSSLGVGELWRTVLALLGSTSKDGAVMRKVPCSAKKSSTLPADHCPAPVSEGNGSPAATAAAASGPCHSAVPPSAASNLGLGLRLRPKAGGASASASGASEKGGAGTSAKAGAAGLAGAPMTSASSSAPAIGTGTVPRPPAVSSKSSPRPPGPPVVGAGTSTATRPPAVGATRSSSAGAPPPLPSAGTGTVSRPPGPPGTAGKAGASTLGSSTKPTFASSATTPKSGSKAAPAILAGSSGGKTLVAAGSTAKPSPTGSAASGNGAATGTGAAARTASTAGTAKVAGAGASGTTPTATTSKLGTAGTSSGTSAARPPLERAGVRTERVLGTAGASTNASGSPPNGLGNLATATSAAAPRTLSASSASKLPNSLPAAEVKGGEASRSASSSAQAGAPVGMLAILGGISDFLAGSQASSGYSEEQRRGCIACALRLAKPELGNVLTRLHSLSASCWARAGSSDLPVLKALAVLLDTPHVAADALADAVAWRLVRHPQKMWRQEFRRVALALLVRAPPRSDSEVEIAQLALKATQAVATAAFCVLLDVPP